MVSPEDDSLLYLVFDIYQRLWIHKDELDAENYKRFNRWPMTNDFSSYFAAIQPVPAYLGLISCLTIVFFFNSAGMWNGNQPLLKGLNIYLGVRILQCYIHIFSILLTPLACNLTTSIYNPQTHQSAQLGDTKRRLGNIT